MKIIFKLLKI